MPARRGLAADDGPYDWARFSTRYDVIESLGRRHGIEVASAIDVVDGRHVILKRQLWPGGRETAAADSPLAHEYRVLSLLSHECIPAALHFSVDRGGMEHLVVGVEPDWIDVRAWVAGGAPAMDEFLAWFGDLLAVLDYVHGRGLVHCDLSPASVVVRPAARFRDQLTAGVRHFEFSHWFSHSEWFPERSDRFFMPPEHGTLSTPSPRFDLYSAGALAVYILVDERDRAAVEVLAPSDLLSRIPDETPSDLRQLLERILAADEPVRPSGVAELRGPLAALGCPAFAEAELHVRGAEACGTVPRRSLSAAIETALNAAVMKPGHVLLVVGSGGSGKTAALKLIQIEARAQGLVCLQATRRNDRTGRVVLADAFRALAVEMCAGSDAGASVPRRFESDSVSALFSEERCARQELPRTAVCIADSIDELPPEDLDLLVRLAHRARDESPPILIAASCRQVPRALARSEGLPLAPEVAGSCGGCGPLLSSVEAHPIGPMLVREVASLIGDLCCWSPSPQLAELIAGKSQGNPLLARLLIERLSTSGNLMHSSKGLVSRPGCFASLGGTSSIAALLQDDVGASEGSESRVAEVVALGPGLTSDVVSAVSGLSVTEVEDVLRVLTSRGLLVPTRTGDEICYAHAVIRDAVYDGIALNERSQLHSRAARAILDGAGCPDVARREQVLAWHLYRSDDPARALPYAITGTADLAGRGRPEESADFLNIVEELAPLGTGDRGHAMGLLLRAAECYWRYGRPGLSARACEAALALGGQNDGASDQMLLELYWTLGRSSALSGDPAAAVRAFDEALRIAEQAGHAVWLGKVYSGMCMVRQMRGQLQESVSLARKSVAFLEDGQSPELLSFSRNALGNALLAVSSWREALGWYERAAESAEHAGDKSRLSTNLGNMGLAHMNLGDWDRAEQCLEESLALARELGHVYSMELGYGNMGFIRMRRGALDESEAYLREAIALAEMCGDEWGLALTLSNFGELERLRGNPISALDLYGRSQQLMQRIGSVDDLPEVLRCRAEALVALSRFGDAHDAATRARDLASGMGKILEDANSSRVLAEIAARRGEPDEAVGLCRTAIEKLEGIGAKYELAQALAARGRISLGLGEPDEGVSFLGSAERIFVELGARRDARIVQEELSQVVAGSIVPPRGLPDERQRLASLYRSSRSLSVAQSVEALLRELADISAANVHADTAAAVLLSPPEAMTAVLSSICDSEEVPESLYSLVSSMLEMLPEGDASAVIQERGEDAGLLFRTKGIRRAVIAPMIAGRRTVGALYMDYRRRDREFSDQDMRFLEALAAQGATAIDNMQLRARLEDEVEYLRWEIDGKCSFSNIIGQSLEMQRLYSVLQKVSRSSVTVLIEGESGTGKELVARALHYDGPRKKERFVAQNCAALPEQLLESELFGHVRGAFTGALRDKAGLFEAADCGTFFLDEIADMPPSLQVKLLRVLQDGEVRRVGATDPTSVDVRIIAATNKSLEEEVKSGRFREDLYYRLNVVRIVIPPLRDRRDDIPLLAQHFLNKMTSDMDRPPTGFTDAAMDLLINYDWPGNVRELENEIERAVALSEPGAGITARVLSDRIRSVQVVVRPPKPGDRTSLKDMIEDVEKRVILQILNENNWNKSRAAEALGLSRQGLLKKIARLELKPEEE